MKAIVLTKLGAPLEVLKYTTEHPLPVRKPGEVLIALHATSINPAEWRIMTGSLPKAMIAVPQILGIDIAGVVKEADPSSKFKAGDRVVGCSDQILKDPWGTYAEFVSVKEELLTLIPEGVTFEQAAALPCAGMTAWQALAPSMPLAGKRVLVHGGAGGVGHFAVQIAKAQGAFVATTCSPRNLDFVTRKLGADLAIDHTQGKLLEAAGEPYDLVVDFVGAEPKSWPLLKRSGRMAAASFDLMVEGKSGFSMMFAIIRRVLWLKLAAALGLCPKYDMVNQELQPEKGLQQLASLVAEGKVLVHIDRLMSLEQVPEAHELRLKGGVRGKIVIQVAP